MPRFDSIDFYQNRPLIKLFLLKNTKFSSAEASAPQSSEPPAAEASVLRLPSLQRLGASPPDPQLPPTAKGFAPRSRNSPPLQISCHVVAWIVVDLNAYDIFFI